MAKFLIVMGDAEHDDGFEPCLGVVIDPFGAHLRDPGHLAIARIDERRQRRRPFLRAAMSRFRRDRRVGGGDGFGAGGAEVAQRLIRLLPPVEPFLHLAEKSGVHVRRPPDHGGAARPVLP